MTDRHGLSQDEARHLFEYDAETGVMVWKPRPLEDFPDEHTFGMWNTRFAGKKAGHDNSHGYLTITAHHRCRYQGHRVIWLWVYGEWPKGVIDHINGDPMDNRIANLRCVSHRENMRNMKLRTTNKSGITGVRWYAARAKWVASIKLDEKSQHLGYFDTKEEAAAVRKLYSEKHGYHPNHGRAA